MHGAGHRPRDDVDLALPFSLVWSGRGIKTFTATADLPVRRGRAGAVRDLGVRRRLLGRPHEEPRRRRAEAGVRGARAGADATSTPRALEPLLGRRGRWPSSTGSCARGSPRMGYPGQPSHPICHGIGARAHEPPYPHQAGGGTFEEGMVLAIEPGVYWEGGGGLRVEDNFLITATGSRSCRAFPDGIVRCGERDLDRRAERRVPRRRQRRSVRHDAARRRADRRRRARPGAEARDRAAARRARDRPDRGRLPARLAGRLATRSS